MMITFKNYAKAKYFLSMLVKAFKIFAICCALCVIFPHQGFPQDDELSNRQEIVTKVFWDIVRAYGMPYPNNQPPQLIFSDDKKIALWVSPNKIYIENKFISLCFEKYKSRAQDALAVILGHELTHYFEQHDVSDFGFIDRNNDEIVQIMNYIDANQSSQSEEELNIGRNAIRKMMEAQADRRGMFFGYVAGYNTFKNYASLIEDIYSWYNLSDSKLEWAYFSKTERKAIANNQIIQLKKLIPIFESAVFLLISGKYESAAICFDYLADEFPTREMFNNSGLSRLLAAWNLLGPDDVVSYDGKKLKMPFFLASSSRLKEKDIFERGTEMSKSTDMKIIELLDAAERSFKQAIIVSPDYFQSHANKILLALMDNRKKIFDTDIKDLIVVAKTESDTLNMKVLQGLWFAKQYKFDDSKNVFGKIRNKSIIADYNMSLLSNVKNDGLDSGIFQVGQRPTFMVDGNSFGDAMNFHFNMLEYHTKDGKLIMEIGEYKHNREWFAYNAIDSHDQTYYFFVAKSDYEGDFGVNLMIGSHKEEIIKLLGEPDLTYLTSVGSIAVYNHYNVAFNLDFNDTISGFLMF